MKNIWIWTIIVVIIGGGYYFLSQKSSSRQANGDPIKIGQMSALTGVGSDIGEEERNGALLAAEEINARGGIQGRPIEILSADAPAFDLKQVVSAGEKLISVDKVLAIVGPQWDGAAEVMAITSANRKTPVISPNASTDIEAKVNSPYFFTTWPDNEIGVRELLKFAATRGWRKIAIIEPANFSFWLYAADLFEKNAPEFGVQIVSKEMGTDYAVVDYRTLIAKAKTKNPDALFGSYADLECVFLKQTKELGLGLPLLSTESAGTPKALSDCAAGMEDRLYFATPAQSNGYDVFSKAYEARFGRKSISPSAVTSYNAVLVLNAVIADILTSGKELTGENIKDGLAAVQFDGAVSIPQIQFNDKGFVITSPDAFEMRTVKAGEFVQVK